MAGRGDNNKHGSSGRGSSNQSNHGATEQKQQSQTTANKPAGRHQESRRSQKTLR